MKIRFALALVAALAVPAVATAAGKAGISYAGFTKSGQPIVIQVARDGKHITRALMGLDMTCTSGATFPAPDGYGKLKISKSGGFKGSFANQVIDEGQGKTALLSGSMSGKFNKARTKITGTWHLHDTERDAQGTATDQCDSGTARFSAVQ